MKNLLQIAGGFVLATHLAACGSDNTSGTTTQVTPSEERVTTDKYTLTECSELSAKELVDEGLSLIHI